MAPLGALSGWSWPISLRRLLGLFAFAYASLHFCVWLVLDHFFAWKQMGADIVKRPYITVGMTALVLMIPLAATSTAGAIRRLGGGRWPGRPPPGYGDRGDRGACSSLPPPQGYPAPHLFLGPFLWPSGL